VGDDFVYCEGSVGYPEQFEALVPLMRADLAYVNIVTQQYPGSELRGQISGTSSPSPNPAPTSLETMRCRPQ